MFNSLCWIFFKFLYFTRHKISITILVYILGLDSKCQSNVHNLICEIKKCETFKVSYNNIINVHDIGELGKVYR